MAQLSSHVCIFSNVAGAGVNVKTSAGEVPVELLLADNVKGRAAVFPPDQQPYTVADILNLLPKEKIHAESFVRRGSLPFYTLFGYYY
jgi:hypothetical protein